MSRQRSYQIKVVREKAAGTPDYLLLSGRVSRMMGETETPLLDLYENESQIIIEVDLPGVDIQKEVAVKAVHNQLTIEGRRRESDAPAGPSGTRFLRMERALEEFKRIVPIPSPVDPRRARAEYRNGVLTIVLPKIPDRREREVRINIAR